MTRSALRMKMTYCWLCGQQRGLATASEVIDQLNADRARLRARLAERMAHYERKLAERQSELARAHDQLDTLRGLNLFNDVERDPTQKLN
jgi:hypothetical protein